jgi:hypothetical protein
MFAFFGLGPFELANIALLAVLVLVVLLSIIRHRD